MNPQVGGAAPKAPGIYRIPARMTERGGRSLGLRSFRLLSRRSGCVPAVPYPPLRSFQSGLLQPRRAMIYQRTAITPLTLCLIPGVQFNKPLSFQLKGIDHGHPYLAERSISKETP